MSSSAPVMGADVHHATVKHILEKHATHLMEAKELQELVAFAKGTQFDITVSSEQAALSIALFRKFCFHG